MPIVRVPEDAASPVLAQHSSQDGPALPWQDVDTGVFAQATQETESLLALNRRFKLITRTAGIGYWSQREPKGQAEWSETLRALVGLPSGAPVPTLAQWFERHVHPDDRQRVRRLGSAWMRSRKASLELGFRILRPGGEVRQLMTHSQHETDAPSALLFGVVVDVTERHSTEQALRSASERAALATRAAGLGTWDVDLLDNSAHWDEQMWLLRGREPQPGAMSLEERLDCVHPEDRENVIARYQDGFNAHQPVEDQFRVVWPNGQVHWLATRSQTLRDDHGKPVRRIGMNWDITDARNAEGLRREAELAVHESAAKSRFTARMSHELRTPLNAMLGFAQLLAADETSADSESRSRLRRLAHIQAAGQHLLTLINDVLDLSSLEGGELRISLQPVALAPLVQTAVSMLGPLLASHRVRLQTGALEAVAMADATRLRQVLLNLLSNAVKYNRAGGLVQVQARIEKQAVGAWVVLQVSDTGIGMTAEQQAQLFEPFKRLHQLDSSIEGSGIGLTICKSLVERMGGSIQVRSQPGVGSSFELWLTAPPQPVPATTTPLAAALAPALAAPDQKLPRSVHRLLYIEDNPVNALILSELLSRRQDLALTVAADGHSGLSLARKLQPELILLDMQLPDINGLEVMRRLRADPATAGITCIALSANAMPEDIQRALSGGAADYWTKPLDFAAFFLALNKRFGPGP